MRVAVSNFKIIIIYTCVFSFMYTSNLTTIILGRFRKTELQKFLVMVVLYM